MISGNGEFITVQSTDNLDPDANAYSRNQIFRADFDGRNFKQISLSSSLHSYDPAISNDGNRIVFRSNASLAGTNSASNSEIFLYEHKQGRLRAMTEVNQNKDATLPKLSSDGSTIVFQGNADWVTGDNPGFNNQIFFQTNLGKGAVMSYEDPDLQYKNAVYKSSTEIDEEATKEMIKKSTGNFSWAFIILLSLLACRKNQIKQTA
jgi:Tol biopolymer transport system component